MKHLDRFHKHLDECPQCRDHPFDLCSIGAVLIRWAAEEPSKPFKEGKDDGSE